MTTRPGVPAIIYKQFPGEPVQTFAWRVQQAITEMSGNSDVSEPRLFRRVLSGLHASVLKLMKPLPATLSQLFVKFEQIVPLIPSDDDFWRSSEMTSSKSPEATIAVEMDTTERYNPNPCYKCGIVGHFASKACQRNKAIQPKRKRRGRKNRPRDLQKMNFRLGRGSVRKSLHNNSVSKL